MIPEKKINILGEDITIRFNMAVQIAYEELTGEPFNVGDLKRQKNSVALYFAAIVSNNKETQLTINDLLENISGKELAELSKAVYDCMAEWLGIPSVIQDDQTAEDDEKN